MSKLYIFFIFSFILFISAKIYGVDASLEMDGGETYDSYRTLPRSFMKDDKPSHYKLRNNIIDYDNNNEMFFDDEVGLSHFSSKVIDLDNNNEYEDEDYEEDISPTFSISLNLRKAYIKEININIILGSIEDLDSDEKIRYFPMIQDLSTPEEEINASSHTFKANSPKAKAKSLIRYLPYNLTVEDKILENAYTPFGSLSVTSCNVMLEPYSPFSVEIVDGNSIRIRVFNNYKKVLRKMREDLLKSSSCNDFVILEGEERHFLKRDTEKENDLEKYEIISYVILFLSFFGLIWICLK